MSITIEERIEIIEKRNKRVELDKAWETSAIRRILISIITFILIGMYLSWLKVNNPWLNAIVPVVGFIMSTLVVQKVKIFWQNKQN